MNKGLTLIELLISLAILAMVVGLVLISFANYRNREVLRAGVLEVSSVLQEARSKTLGAEGDSVYGVHFDSDQVVLFVGSAYNMNSSSNATSTLPNSLGLATSTLGSSQVVFSKLSGEPSVSGEVVVYRRSDPSASTTITIHSSGIISSP